MASNLAESFAFDLTLDLELSSFTEAAEVFSSEFSLDTLFQDVTNLLDTIASYGPELNAGEAPSPVSGLLNGKKNCALACYIVLYYTHPQYPLFDTVVNDAKDFATGLQDFIEIVGDGESDNLLIKCLSLDVMQQHLNTNSIIFLHYSGRFDSN